MTKKHTVIKMRTTLEVSKVSRTGPGVGGPKHECTKGWSDRCAKAGSAGCTCACGGENHGKRGRHAGSSAKASDLAPDSVAGGRGHIVGLYRNGVATVYVDGVRLDPRPSLKLVNHSPTGFQWGYSGSGPAQTALAILLHVKGKEYALQHYQAFKARVISGLKQGKDFKIKLSKAR